MLISTKGQYALRLMLDLAVFGNGESVAIKAIAERQSISEKYLEQIVSGLSRAGYVKSTRGSKGGYKLTKSPEEYTVGDILRVAEGSIEPVDWDSSDLDTTDIIESVTNEVWRSLEQSINNVVDNLTLASLVDDYNSRVGFVYMI